MGPKEWAGPCGVRDAVERRARWEQAPNESCSVTESGRAKDGVGRGRRREGAGPGEGASVKWGGAAWGRNLSEEKRPWVEPPGVPSMGRREPGSGAAGRARRRRRVAQGGATGRH